MVNFLQNLKSRKLKNDKTNEANTPILDHDEIDKRPSSKWAFFQQRK